jgi:hypothetical protein
MRKEKGDFFLSFVASRSSLVTCRLYSVAEPVEFLEQRVQKQCGH